MASSDLPAPLLQALSDVRAWTESAKIPAIIIGGVAASLLGRPRLTRDIDTLVNLPEARWGKAVAHAAKHNLSPRIGDAVEFAKRSRVLLLRHDPTQIDIDVTLGLLPFEIAAIENGHTVLIGPVEVRLPRVEDLLIMKAIAHRARDLSDIEGLLELHPNADLDEVLRWVREFSTAATTPELLEDFERLVARRAGRR
jgi:Nucleotidyl transferase AbiEii toxin, Type IV TA system